MTAPLLTQHLRDRRDLVVVRVDASATPALAAHRLSVTGTAALPGVCEGLRRGGAVPVVDLDGCPPGLLAGLDVPAFTTDPALARAGLRAGRRVLVPTWAQDVVPLVDAAVRSAAILFAPARLRDDTPPAPAGDGDLRVLHRRGSATLLALGTQVAAAVTAARMLTGRGVAVGAGVCADVPAEAAVLLDGGLAVVLDADPSGSGAWRPVELDAGLGPREVMEAVMAAMPLGALTTDQGR